MLTVDSHSSGHLLQSHVGLACTQLVQTNTFPKFDMIFRSLQSCIPILMYCLGLTAFHLYMYDFMSVEPVLNSSIKISPFYEAIFVKTSLLRIGQFTKKKKTEEKRNRSDPVQ